MLLEQNIMLENKRACNNATVKCSHKIYKWKAERFSILSCFELNKNVKFMLKTILLLFCNHQIVTCVMPFENVVLRYKYQFSYLGYVSIK